MTKVCIKFETCKYFVEKFRKKCRQGMKRNEKGINQGMIPWKFVEVEERNHPSPLIISRSRSERLTCIVRSALASALALALALALAKSSDII